jgi:hypothetical protein
MHRLDQSDQLADIAIELLRICTGHVVGKRELRARKREQRSALGEVKPQRASERVETSGDGLMSRPCSSHVYQDTPTPASAASSSRLRPGVLRGPPLSRSPTSAGDNRARRERRNARSSSRREGEEATVIVRLSP